MQFSFSDYINDIVRVLIVLCVSNDYKSVNLTERRIELFDFFLRFPKTMTLSGDQDFDVSVEEYYSFFHWQPDIIRYRQAIYFLISKGFIEKRINDNSVVYRVTDKGKTALEKLNNPYKNRLMILMVVIIKQLSKLSDKRIEELILENSKKHIKEGL